MLKNVTQIQITTLIRIALRETFPTDSSPGVAPRPSTGMMPDASKFSNRMLVIDPDPNGDGDPSGARIAGKVGFFAASNTVMDDRITANPGMGGQVILTIPLVYNGWVQNLLAIWRNQRTPAQQNPIR